MNAAEKVAELVLKITGKNIMYLPNETAAEIILEALIKLQGESK